MRHIEIVAKTPERSPDEMYQVLCDFDQYPRYSSVVHSVTVEHAADGHVVSNWEVEFRGGILKWIEEDRFQPKDRMITFQQIGGDVDHFAGVWQVSEAGSGALVRFEADFDMGIPGLAAMVEPIAEQALTDNIKAIITGLSGGSVEFVSVTAAPKD